MLFRFRVRSDRRDRLAEVRRHDRRCERFDAVDDGLEADRAEEVERVLGAGQLGVDDGVGGGAAGFARRARAVFGEVSASWPPWTMRTGAEPRSA
jgi:hypothetical protein